MPSEHSEQVELVRRLRRAGICFAAVPNGANLRGGRRAGAALKREGMEPGVPDLLIFDAPNQLRPQKQLERDMVVRLLSLSPDALARVLALVQRGGSAIELKRVGGGQLSAHQRAWGDKLRARGWRWACVHGWRAALDQLAAWGYGGLD